MWSKKSEADEDMIEQAVTPTPVHPVPQNGARGTATIGPSISIRGDLSGDEDLIIQGRVEGSVSLQQNNVTVGKEGRIRASICGRIITVEGHVEGDLNGEEKVIIRASGHVRGNIVSPRVTLEDGCRFKGSIDMEVKPAAKPAAEASVSSLKPVMSAPKETIGTSIPESKNTQTAPAK